MHYYNSYFYRSLLCKINKFLENLYQQFINYHIIFKPRRCDLRIESFLRGHDGDFIHIKNNYTYLKNFFDQHKVK